ncbi:nuclear transport factor 2 family protein [Ruicaihuangia caeni]|uniref:Nuclear transport factor 2 family protein n=1 Tax=Ruicaihuangia caeni TaxID=3042517 RepID=A0AAW6T7R5_9MICO|nr:nuclear transport factor 2 family protein [Klugiella sp. YN-L-19]MDI2099136.1 nuclear transport factor 2 family protein [Klugiella sp. YN-L-19]
MSERAQQNLAVLREYFDAMTQGGPPATMPFYADDAELIVPGSHEASGTYRGLDGVGQFGATMRRLTDGTFRLSPIDLFASDDRVVTYATASAEAGGKRLEWTRVIMTDIVEGKFARLQFFESDQDAVDALLTGASS